MLINHASSQVMKKGGTRHSLEARYAPKLTWELYNWQYYARKGRPMWVIHDGPPFASGKAHIGHMYNKSIKDMINRYKVMRGYRVHFVNGYDCYGTQIEDKALREDVKMGGDLKIDKEKEKEGEYKMSAKEKEVIRKRGVVREFVKRSAVSQMQDFTKWGIMSDWR